MLPISFAIFGLLFPFQSFGQILLANEPNAGTNGDAPTEEDLIQKLLKSPGLPPAMPSSLGVEPPKNEGNGKTTTTMAQMPRGPEGLPPLSAFSPSTVSQFAGVDSFSASQPGGGVGSILPPSAPPSYIQCLHQIGARLCDPEGILNGKERTEIDETLGELEAATRKENAATECEKAGLELMVILVRHSALLDDPMNSVQSKLNNVLGMWVRDPGHKCEKPVILMLSADPQMMNRRVWTGRHWDVPVNPSELVQLFMEQEELTRKEKYGEVILNVIEGVLSRYEKRALQGA